VKRLLLAAAAALVACEGPTIPPRVESEIYPFHLATSPPSVLRWPSGTAIRVFVAGGSGERATILHEAFTEGAAVWNASARYGEYELVEAASLREADVLLRWSDDVVPVDLTGCEPEISRAVTTFCLSDDDPTRLHVYPLAGADAGAASSVRMIVTILGSEASRTDRGRRLVVHELGHVLGIARHSPVADDLMFGGELTRSTLSRRDAATIGVLYHTQAGVTP
jgi:predicted Zn-dependent protease